MPFRLGIKKVLFSARDAARAIVPRDLAFLELLVLAYIY
jgi:hypothetical protein